MEEDEFEFEANDGKVYTFPTKEERDNFSIEYSIMSLVAEGYGEISEIDDESTFKVNDRGIRHLEELEGESNGTQDQKN